MRGWPRVWRSALGIALVLALAACATATRPVVEPTVQGLTEKRRGVAVVKFSMPDELCLQQVLVIGTREGNGHREVRRLWAKGTHAPTTANAAEVELEPGEYQVMGYVCQRARSYVGIGSAGGPYTGSIGSFTVGPGEVVNIGHITFKKKWGSLKVDTAVSDWSLPDLNRFRDERPQLFAGMRTRLLTLKAGQPLTAEEKADRCGQYRELHASGKVQKLPGDCT